MNTISLHVCIALFVTALASSASAEPMHSADNVEVVVTRSDSTPVRRTIDDLAVFERFVADQAAPFSTPDRSRNDMVLGATGVVAIAGAIAHITTGNEHSSGLRWLPSPWIGCNLAGATVGGSWQ
jgi:hypothetical protein